MSKKLFIIIIVIAVLVIFLFPKITYRGDDTFTAELNKMDSFKNMDCKCIGFAMDKPGLTRSDTIIKYCIGIPVSCKYTCSKKTDEKWESISCDELS